MKHREAHSPAEGSTALKPNAVGLAAATFQSIATSAPAGAAATALLIVTVYAGGATPLAILLAVLACLLVSVSIGQLAVYLPSAGGLGTYVSRSLGHRAAFLAAWGMLISYAVIPMFYFAFFGLLVKGLFDAHVGGTPSWFWVPFALLLAAGVWWLTHHGVNISTRAGVVLGVIEITILVILAVTLVVDAGSHNTLSVFAPHTSNKHGWGSILAGALYAVLALVGFESAVPIAEEAKDPRRTIGRAVIGSTLALGAIFVVVYYAAAVYLHPSAMLGFSTINKGDPLTYLGDRVWAGLGIVVVLAVLNSIAASCNGSTNAATRIAYAMARVGLLPARIGRVHASHRTPHVAIALLMVLSAAVAVIGGLAANGGPLDLVVALGTTLTVIFIPIYILVAISSGAFYWRHQRARFNPLLHVLVPLLATAFFALVEIASFGIDFAGLGIAPVVGPAKVGLWIAAIWMALGLIVLATMARNHPAALRGMDDVFREDPNAALATGPSAADSGIAGGVVRTPGHAD